MKPMEGPPLVAHLHLHRNAGSTMDWVLRRNFGEAFATIHGSSPDSVLSEAEVSRFVGAHPGILAVSSHDLRLPLEIAGGRTVLPILLLRHPIDRVGSMYEHERRTSEAAGVAGSFPCLKAWVEEKLNHASYLVCDFQTMFLAAGVDCQSLPTPIEFREAEYVMEQLPFCGVVDQFERSMLVLESMIRRWYPGFDGAFSPQNVSGGRGATLEVRLARMRDELGPLLYRYLELANAYDTQLVEDARVVLARRIEGLPGWQSGLDGIHRRVEGLHGSVSDVA